MTLFSNFLADVNLDFFNILKYRLDKVTSQYRNVFRILNF